MVAKKRKSPTEETPATAVTIAPPTEENFVRGGASALTPLEHKEISTQAANDLFKAVRICQTNKSHAMVY
jgi:rRNA biogenesis protein RRP5